MLLLLLYKLVIGNVNQIYHFQSNYNCIMKWNNSNNGRPIKSYLFNDSSTFADIEHIFYLKIYLAVKQNTFELKNKVLSLI